ncbi:uridine diphosphate glucose pyrophosphatase NUDT14 isoform X2 [Rousettus aegyptiacus]|uniref:uridine diphosphate glucose pyrophosphatase NUDT14 isoform X2 n=1 Tax=Rousettus aegyptiacus TaxID=9407 RepID=UPI00168D8967|nr:uridine diphosphate glucose pyrophosphatase NUDT14 isoform X2 [Rousettus aegyptiacus]
MTSPLPPLPAPLGSRDRPRLFPGPNLSSPGAWPRCPTTPSPGGGRPLAGRHRSAHGLQSCTAKPPLPQPRRPKSPSTGDQPSDPCPPAPLGPHARRAPGGRARHLQPPASATCARAPPRPRRPPRPARTGHAQCRVTRPHARGPRAPGRARPASPRAAWSASRGRRWAAAQPRPTCGRSRCTTARSGVGLTGSSQTMFYAEVTDGHRAGPGGGLAEEGELIEVVHLPLDGAQAFADNPDVPKTLGVIFGISWFLSCVAPGVGPQ